MSTSVDQAFIRQYEAEVHEAYQRRGSKIRNTVRQKNSIQGESTTFQKVGKGTASGKTRHGKVPVMNIDHTPVVCTLGDYYAGDYVDKLDELKTNIDEKGVTQNAGAFALGRKTDDLIIDSMENATNQSAATIQANGTSGSSTGMNLGKALDAWENIASRDVSIDDGELYCWVGPKQWVELMRVAEFSSADYVNADDLPFKMRGAAAKYWLNATWIMHTGLPLSSGDIRSCFMAHRTAIGHASGADVMVDITWQGERAAHFVNNMMSQGSCLIDDNGVQEILCDESP